MQYATKKDVIEKYAQSRKNVEEEDVEDLINTFIDYLNMKLDRSTRSSNYVVSVDGLGKFYEYQFDSRQLAEKKDSHIKIKTENLMHEWALGNIKINPRKDFDIKFDYKNNLHVKDY